ncbi:MFS transporter [Bradyrhizobium sp. Arg62]|uniref:MFS transporter n=1 Tax=Bradyrhizobium brasilense TaxID=1419277 RepID=UPI001E3B44F0|nr:MFS transporter [Bradyrhizobium brasilense]MCC8943547.1 MFS transporter [Bradyrhizobium brasilense]
MQEPVIATLEARAGEFRRGWPAMIACLIGHAIGLHTLPPFTIGLFIVPLQQDFGWSRTSISLGITIITIGTALSAPLVGAIVDRVGERILIATGMAMLAAGYFALSLMAGSISQFWVIMALMALLGAGCTPVTLSRIIVGLFDRRRGTALGLVLIGTGVAGAVAPVLLSPIIAASGWRAGYQTLALVMLVGLPIVVGLLALNRVGDAQPQSTGGRGVESPVTVGEVARQPIFLRLLIPIALVALGTGGVVVHFVPMLIDAGFARAHAGQMAGLLGVSVVFARLLVGVAIDYVFAPLVATILMAASAVGFLGLALGGQGLTPLAAVLVGLSLGAEVDLVVYLASRYFPERSFGRAYGMLYSAFLVSVAMSPLVYAGFREAIGNYRPGFAWAAVFLAVSSICFAALPRFRTEASAAV